MTDNPKFADHARTFNRYGGIRGLTDEIDALRAEIERLRAALHRIAADYYGDRHGIWARAALNGGGMPACECSDCQRGIRVPHV